MDNKCTKVITCGKGGELVTKAHKCNARSTCGVRDGVRGCVCKKGWKPRGAADCVGRWTEHDMRLS